MVIIKDKQSGFQSSTCRRWIKDLDPKSAQGEGRWIEQSGGSSNFKLVLQDPLNKSSPEIQELQLQEAPLACVLFK